MSHTPGPWNVGEDNDVFGYDGTSCLAKIVGAPEGNQDALANARLIASAPELLAALKHMVDFDQLPSTEAKRRAMRDAVTAIAHAEGTG